MKKRFGQHFLSDVNILRRIVRFAEISPADIVVEIGPGAGALTRELAAVARRVVAIEIDRDLIPGLRAQSASNVDIVEADALEVNFDTIAKERFHVVGNLPYNVATQLFKRFIESRRQIVAVTAMVQKEVAERMVAKPSTDAYGPLSVLIQYYSDPQIGFVVPPGAFRPRPEVDSAVIRLHWRPGVPDAPQFTDFVHAVFSTRRKKLVNNLRRMFVNGRESLLTDMEKAGIAPDARPENLSVEDFIKLFAVLAGRGFPSVYNQDP